MSEDARRPRWALVALLAGVGLVVVIALVAVFARGGPTQYDADTPEGVVQRYSQAVVDGDEARRADLCRARGRAIRASGRSPAPTTTA